MQQDSNSCVQFFLRDGLLYRSWSPKGSQPGDIRSCEQLVLPQLCRELVMRLSHDVPMAGSPRHHQDEGSNFAKVLLARHL